MSLLDERLSAKRQHLVTRASILRQTIAEDVEALTSPLSVVVRLSATAPRITRYIPWVVGAGVAFLIWKKPHRLVGAGRKLISIWQYSAALSPWLVTLLKPTKPDENHRNGLDTG